MSNFKLGHPAIQKEATATANLTASTTRPVTNLFSGTRSERFELATASADHLTVNYDLGASSTKTANFLAIMRAKLLHRNDCTGVRLRGSTQSATLPSTLTPTAWFDPNRGVTTVSGAVSQWNDLSGNAYHATQGTAANRPLLSRPDNNENRFQYSQAFSNAAWATVSATETDNQVANPIDGTTTGAKHTASGGVTTHYVYQTPPACIVGVSYRSWFYAKIGSANMSVQLSWQNLCACTYDLAGGSAVVDSDSTGGTAVATQTSVGNGWYKCQLVVTPHTAVGVWRIYLKKSNNTTFDGAAADYVYIYGAQFQASACNTTPLITTYPQWSGINGNRALVFDGSNDNLVNVSASVTHPRTVFIVARPTNLGTGQMLLAQYSGNTVQKYFNSGSIVSSYSNPNTLNTVGANSNNTTYVLSFVDDTASSAVYINGVSSATGTLANLTTTGFSIGYNFASSSFAYYGYICEIIIYNSALSAGNRQAVEAYLTTKYQTTPLVQLDSLSTTTLMGPNDEDYFTVFTESAAFRHWWLELVNEGTASKYNCGKVFFGKALDLGREPKRPIEISQSRQNTWSREAALSTVLQFEAIKDTEKETLLNDVIPDSDVLALVALDPAQYVINDSKGMHCKIVDHSVDPYYGTDNNITLAIEEEI